MASSKFVLPWPFCPTKTLKRSRGASSTGWRLRTPVAVNSSIFTWSPAAPRASARSDAHRHDDAEILVAAERSDQAGAELAAESEGDLIRRHLTEQLDDVLRVEPDRDGLAVVLGVELLANLAEVWIVARDRHAVFAR